MVDLCPICFLVVGASRGYEIIDTRYLLEVTSWLMMVTSGGSGLFEGRPPQLTNLTLECLGQSLHRLALA